MFNLAANVSYWRERRCREIHESMWWNLRYTYSALQLTVDNFCRWNLLFIHVIPS